MISQFRTMKFFFMHFFFQVSKRIRHQIFVFFTSQIDFRNFFVFFSVMFFFSSATASSILQSQKRSQSKFKLKKFRSMTNAVQMNETKFSTNVDPNNSKQSRIGKEIQIPNIFATKVLVTKLTQNCFCKNDVA